MLQRLPVALAQVKAGNTSEHLLNEILEIIYSLYRETEFTKKVYNNIMNSIIYKIECILYLWILKLVKNQEKSDNPSVKIYVSKIEYRVTFKINRILSQTFNSWLYKFIFP